MASTYFRRQENVLREMEAAWEPLGSPPKVPLLDYDPESDPFCPLAVARKFNQLQREATANGTQSLIDLRPSVRASKKRATKLSQQCPSTSGRPRSSGGRIEPAAASSAAAAPMHGGVGGGGGGGGGARLAPPSIAGATLKLQEGGGFTAVVSQPPPLRAQGLPSSAQLLREGRGARGGEGGERKRAWKKKTTANSSTSGNNDIEGLMSAEQGRSGTTVELVADALKKEFAAKLARREDILQDVWLKMHSGQQAFATVEGQLVRLLGLYRSASLEVVEGMMRHPQLEKIADEHADKKGEGTQSYCAVVARDADFADGVPEAAAWLGFPARRNPFLLPPPKGDRPSPPSSPMPEIGLDSAGDMARFRDAQDFILNNASPDAKKNKPCGDEGGVSIQAGAESRGGGDGGGGGGGGGGGRDTNNNASTLGRSSASRKLRDKMRAISGELVAAQDTIRDLEESLSSLEAERGAGRERAARVRQAAAHAGKQKMAQKMYRLRGDAAFVEDGLEELEGEITAVRVRLFAERLDVARRRMLKDALAAEAAAKSRALRRRATKHRTGGFPQICSASGCGDDNEEGRLLEDKSAATVIQARVRGMGVRSAIAVEIRDVAKSDRSRRSTSRTNEAAAAVRIEAAARGRLVRKQNRAPAKTQTAPQQSALVAVEAGVTTTATAAEHDGRGTAEDFATPGVGVSHRTGLGLRLGVGTGARGEVHASREEAPGFVPKKEDEPPNTASLDALGVTGVAAFFDSLGLGAYTNRIRRRKQSPTACDGDGGGSGGGGGDKSSGSSRRVVGIDGAELARIASASDPDAELLEIGVSARLHRVKLLAALGVKRPSGRAVREKNVAPVRDAGSATIADSSVSCAPPVTPVAARAALFMVQSIRREQEVMDEALRSVAQGVQAVLDPPTTEERIRLSEKEEGDEEEEEGGGSRGQGGVAGLAVGLPDNGSQNNEKEKSSDGSTNHSPVAGRAQRTGTSPAGSGLVTTGGSIIQPRINYGRVLLDGVQTATPVAAERRRTAAVGEGGLVSVPLRLLPELEQAFSAQVRLSSQVRDVLQCCRVNGRSNYPFESGEAVVGDEAVAVADNVGAAGTAPPLADATARSSTIIVGRVSTP